MPKTLGFREGIEAITKLALELADQISTPVILIDGRAGSGKSTFAQQLRDGLFRQGEAAPVIVSMDELYPGWHGLKEGSLYLERNILFPLSQAKKAQWQTWNWETGKRGNPQEPGNGWREFTGGNALIVEGCGSLSKQSAVIATFRVWVEADDLYRKERFHDRDSGRFDEYWGIWEAQEDEFYAAEKTRELADFVIEN